MVQNGTGLFILKLDKAVPNRNRVHSIDEKSTNINIETVCVKKTCICCKTCFDTLKYDHPDKAVEKYLNVHSILRQTEYLFSLSGTDRRTC